DFLHSGARLNLSWLAGRAFDLPGPYYAGRTATMQAENTRRGLLVCARGRNSPIIWGIRPLTDRAFGGENARLACRIETRLRQLRRDPRIEPRADPGSK